MQDLSNHVGMGFMENLLTATLTIWQTISDVTGAKERKRPAGKMSRTSGAGAPSVADLTSATFWSKKSAKASAKRPLAQLYASQYFKICTIALLNIGVC